MQTIRMSGWLESRIADLVTGNAATFNSEDWANIRHYYKQFGEDAPIATILYVAKEDYFEGRKTQYFLKATNMPHTHDIYNRKLTPYCNKAVETEGPAELAARGYGGILPFLYNGGVTNIQWENPDKTYSQIVTDVDAQKAAALAKADDAALPKPNYTADIVSLGRKAERFYNDLEFWGEEVIEMFTKYGMKTWEVSINPTFNGRENLVGDSTQFRHFLEGLQTQFEEAIMASKLEVIGVFLGDTDKIYYTPYRFQEDNSEALAHDRFVTTSGRYNLMSEFTVEVMHINTVEPSAAPSQYVRYTRQNGEQLYFLWKYSGGTSYTSERLTDPIEFVPDFTHTYGRSPLATAYAGTIKNLPKDELHPLQYESIENYASGCYVSVNGMRATLKPIDIPGFPKVANLMDHSETREFLNILSQRAKKYMHFQDWKECSKFTQTAKPHDNPAVFTILAMLLFVKRAFKGSADRPEDRFIATLSATANVSTGAAAAEGKNYEIVFGRLVEDEFTDMEHTLGDKIIKRDIMKLPLNSQGNQAIDTLHTMEGLWIATQVKSGQRDKDDAFHDFVHTFRILRDKALETGNRCFGILVHYNGVKNGKAIDIVSKEPGLSVVSRDEGERQGEFEQRCLEHIRRIRKYY